MTDIGSDEKGNLYLTDFTHGAILAIQVPPVPAPTKAH